MTVDGFETHPSRYRHWVLNVDGETARLVMDIQEDDGTGKPYLLKLNSYDLSVDIELNDAVNRLRFEHPEVKCVVVTSGKDRIFCAGANIPMLANSTHGFKVNFCRFTNETRLAIEDACEVSGQKYIAACNGVASGGGYELALACEEIILVDDRSSAVSLPEVPLLGVLPGTGGLTRVVDKRHVRRDLADHFSSLAEGVRGRRAVDWKLIDATYKLSKFEEGVGKHVAKWREQIVKTVGPGINLAPIAVELDGASRNYSTVSLQIDEANRLATLIVNAPDAASTEDLESIHKEGCEWWPLRAFRELEDALFHLRFNHSEIGCVVLKTSGSRKGVIAYDHLLETFASDWFVNEVRHFIKRTLKRVDCTAKTFFALVDTDSAFAGTLLELAFAADRIFMLDDPDAAVRMQLSTQNFGTFPMGNGLTRLQSRFFGDQEGLDAVAGEMGEEIETPDAVDLGLVTFAPDDIDWDDEVRVAIEERTHMSPDALTGMEANLRFVGPETIETKIFGRLSAWQNWIFQRPNAVGPEGALKAFEQPTSAQFRWERT